MSGRTPPQALSFIHTFDSYCLMTKITILDRMNGFIVTFLAQSLLITNNATRTCKQYSATADPHNLQFTLAHALGFSVSTSRLIATDLNKETGTLNHYEVFLSSLTKYSSVVICTQLIFTIH
jgi:hypothetical protein